MIKTFYNYIKEELLFKNIGQSEKLNDVIERFHKDAKKIEEYLNEKYAGKNIKIEAPVLDTVISINTKNFEILSYRENNNIGIGARLYSDEIYISDKKYNEKYVILYSKDVITEVEEKERVYTPEDPYGEEEWENESKINEWKSINPEIKNNNNRIKFAILNTLYFKDYDRADLNFLNEHFTGWVIIENQRNYIIHVKKWIRGDATGRKYMIYDTLYSDNMKYKADGHINYRLYYSDLHKIEIIGMTDGKRISHLDPYGEENWNESKINPLGEEDWEYETNEGKKRKKTFNRIKMYDVDPYGEEDWGWDVHIDDSKFKGKYIIYKSYNNHDYIFAILNNHYEIVFSAPSRVNPDGIMISLNALKKYGGLIPMSEREIDRIKRNKLLIIPYKGKHRNNLGEVIRHPFSYLKTDDVYFLDQDYIDNYLYMND